MDYSLWFITNIVLYGLVTVLASTIQLTVDLSEWPWFLTNQALRGVKEYLHYLILVRFTVAEFFTAWITYKMACNHAKCIDTTTA